MHTYNQQQSGRRGSFLRKALALTGISLIMFGVTTGTAQGLSVQAGSDISNVSFSAIDPTTYDHTTGGGYWTDGTTNHVSQLLGDDFACGDYVSFLFLLEVSATPAQPISSAEVVLTFTADSTGQSGTALIVDDTTSQHLRVNSTTEDSGATGDDGSGIINPSVTAAGTRFTGGATESVTFTVTDLEASESIVVRADARIACQPDSTPTGNLQATLTSIDIVAPGDPGAVSGGNQTINLQGVGNIAGVQEALLRVTKTVAEVDGTCPGVDSLDVDLSTSGQVLVCVTVENYGTDPAYNLVVTDDGFTPADDTDDLTLDMSGLTDEDADTALDDLHGGDTASGSILVDVPGAGEYTNTVTAIGDDNDAVTYQSSDTADVVASLTPPTTTIPADLPTVGSRTVGGSSGAALGLIGFGVALLLVARFYPARFRTR